MGVLNEVNKPAVFTKMWEELKPMDDKSEGQKPLNILLVEDAPGDVRLVSEALKQLPISHVLTVAKDGEEALAQLRKGQEGGDASLPDLVLLDLNLPKINGHEVLKEIKNTSRLKRIPVVILTGSKSQEDILKAYDAHANCYITKPSELSEYFEAIQSLGDFWFDFVRLPSLS